MNDSTNYTWNTLYASVILYRIQLKRCYYASRRNSLNLIHFKSVNCKMNSLVILLFLTFLALGFCGVPIDRFSDPCIFIDCNKYKAKTMAPSTPKPIETGVIKAQIVSFFWQKQVKN